jgi:hypothetical protein
MSHTVTETAAFSASVTVPDPGEPVMASDLENAVQPLANRSQWAVRPGDHVLCEAPFVHLGEWNKDFVHVSTATGNSGTSNHESATWGLGFVPDGASITKYGVSITPVGGHGGLPAQLPRLRLYKKSFSSGTLTLIDEVTDPSASLPAYETHHTITKTLATPEPVDHSLVGYFLVFIHESSTNAIDAGLIVHCARVSWS